MADELLGILTGKSAPAPSAAPKFDTDAFARSEAARLGVDPDLISRIGSQESGKNQNRVSKKGAVGYMQLMPDTAKGLGVDPNDVRQNITGGITYFKQMRDRFGDDRLALAAYNAGPEAVQKYGGVPPFAETQDYVASIMEDAPKGADLESVLGVIASQDNPASVKMTPEQSALLRHLTNGGAVDMAAAKKAGNGNYVYTSNSAPVNEAQTKTLGVLERGAVLDPKGKPGSQNLPFVQHDIDTMPQAPGTWWIDLGGKLQQIPRLKGNEEKELKRIGEGLTRGGVDVLQSMGQMLPGTKNSGPLAEMEANRLIYDASHGGDFSAGASRFTGQVGASIPAMFAATELGVPLVAKLGAPGRFIAGRAGAAGAGEGAGLGAKTGNMLLRASSKSAAGSGEGAMASGLTSSTTDAPLSEDLKAGATIGGVLGPALPAIQASGKWTGGLVRDLVDPLTDKGKDRITNRLLQEYSFGGPVDLDLTQYVKGSTPTLAQATGNPGIATLERAVQSAKPMQFTLRSQQNAEARNLAMEAARGDQASLDGLMETRSQLADPIREKAFTEAKPTDPAPVVEVIDQILAGPAGQRDTVVKALTNLRQKLVTEIDTGAGQKLLQPQTDPAQLYGIRQALTDMLSPAARGTERDAQAAAAQLGQVKDALDKVIEAGAPGYQKYLKTFAGASKPIDEQLFLQGLKLTDAQGNVTLGRVDSALEQIRKAKLKPGTSNAKSVSDDTINDLEALRADLMRAKNSELGKSIGSNTFQNLATNNLMGRLGVPAALGVTAGGNPILGGALALGKLAYSSQNEPLLAMLENKLVDASYGKAALDQVGSAAPNMLQQFAARQAARGARIGAVNGMQRFITRPEEALQ